MGRGKIKKIKPVSLQARKAAIAQQQQLQAQKAALERQIAEERSKQARLQREIEEKERLVRGLERVGASAEEAYSYPPPWNTSYPQDYQQQQQLLQRQAQHSDSIAPISDKALSMLNHMLGNRGIMQRDPTTGTIDVVLSPETMASAATSSHLGNTAAGMTSYDPSSLLAGMQGIFAGDVDDEGMLEEGGETNAETREALAEAMAAMKAAAHVAKALPLMMLKSAAQSMSHHGGNGQWTTPSSSSSQYANQPHAVAEAHMVLDPQMMDEHLHEFRAMLEDPEERMRLGVGFEMLGWAVGDPNTAMLDTQRQGEGVGAGGWDGQGKTGDASAAHGSDPVPTLEDMLKLPIFNNEAFRSSPLFGKPVSSANAQAHQPQATPGDLYLESADPQGSTPMDLHNLDMMQDFLSSASGMLNGPIFGGARGGSRDERSAPIAPGAGMGQAGEGWPPPPPPQTQTQTRPRQPPAPRGVPTDVAEYPSGEMTASEAVRAVTELLEASSRKLQKVTGEPGREGDDAVHGEDIDVRLEGRQQDWSRHARSSASDPTATAGSSNVPRAAANAILRARASSSEAASDDTEPSDIDAISLDSDPNIFPEDEFPEDDEGGYYSDEDYEGEEYYENGERVAYTTDDDGEGSSHYTSSDGREGEYDSGDDDEVYESPERLAEFARRRQEAGIPHHPGQGMTNTSIPIAEQQRSSGTPTPTGHAVSTQQRNPISGQQMLEILKRMSPEARHNYQTALMREKMEYERLHQSGVAQSLPSPLPPQSHTQRQQSHLQKQQAQNTARPPSSTQQQKVPSVLDDPAIMDQAVNELFSWIKAVIWTIEQHAIRAARAQMEAKGVTVATGSVEKGKPDGPGESGKNKAAAATWTPKATPDGAKMRAMMRTVGIDVAPA